MDKYQEKRKFSEMSNLSLLKLIFCFIILNNHNLETSLIRYLPSQRTSHTTFLPIVYSILGTNAILLIVRFLFIVEGFE